MQKYLIGLTVLFALGVVTPVNAGFYNGNELMHLCKDANSGGTPMKYNSCVVFFAGVVQAHGTLVVWKLVARPIICIPDGVTQAHLRQVFVNFMQTRPAEWNQDAGSLTLNAFEQAWSCKK